MVTNDATLIQVKHDVLYMVAKLAFNGELEAKEDEIPYELIKGPHASYRCCIYREREITRQRVRLAKGECPTGKDSKNIVQVINAACEDCPLSRYTVTDNCRNCVGKACYNSCKFGAITIGKHRSYIEPDKCKECGMCAKACPYNAIADLVRPCKKSCPVGAITMDDDGICLIDESKCIQCGKCIHSCPFGAIGSKSFIVDIINAMRAGKHVYAMVAPATDGQFGEDITMDSWRTALKATGFTDMVEVALGGDLTAAAEADEWMESYKEGKKKTTSCCPAFVNMIKKHFPELIDNMSTTASPMVGVSRLIKAKDPDALTVFVGPCIAKKSETKEADIEGNADYALTYGEVRAMMRAKSVELKPEKLITMQASTYGKRFGDSAGVTAAVMQSMKEKDFDPKDIKVRVCNGADACKVALMLLKAGKLPEDFIEGMACVGGCVGGPSKHRSPEESKKAREALIAMTDARGVHENLDMQNAADIGMHRSGK